MHIPYTFIPRSQGAVIWIVALVFIALSLRWAKKEMTEEKIPHHPCGRGSLRCIKTRDPGVKEGGVAG